MKSRIRLSAVIALAAIFPAIVQADTLSPARGRRLDLGAFNGVAYYTVETSGFWVVATVARGGDTPVRLETVLAPGQSMILSSPKSRGEDAAKVEITRREDALHVSSLQ